MVCKTDNFPEITPEMIEAGAESLRSTWRTDDETMAYACFMAMAHKSPLFQNTDFRKKP
jgi:hypothetical protein